MAINTSEIIEQIKDHSGTICSGIAVAGVFVTAYFSGKSAVKIDREIDPDLDKKEKAKLYLKAYWKTALSAAVTTGCIIGSDRIHVGKEVALAGAVSMWKKYGEDIDKKLIETVGPEKATEIHNEIAKERIEEKANELSTPVEKDGKLLIYEPYTDQYFYASRETIAWAMLEANRKLMQQYDVRLNYIIGLLGGKTTPEGNKIGWNWENEVQDEAWSYYDGPWIELMPNVVKTKGGKEAFCLMYMVGPETQNKEDMLWSEETWS